MRQIFTDFVFGKIALKKSVYISLICVICVLMVHANSTAADTVTMTMTLNKFGNVKFSVKGSGSITIDWGDRTIDTRNLTPGVVTYSHHYTKKAHRKVIISGQNITHFNCNGCKITDLDVSNNTELQSLRCARNRLTNLDVSRNSALTHLICDNNLLTILDVCANTALTNLVCDNNRLTVLDLSTNTSLTILHCSENQLTSLNLNKNRLLTNVICEGNQLTSLETSNTNALMFMNCRKNRLTAEALNILFGTLNATQEEGKILYIRNNPGTNTCNRGCATDKFWKIDTSFM
ncbi:MAG: hypothetical protein FWH18_08315 [Marinilabiliaceae bacterium]|nr:hypothetical protein [Marinilabiliaceae bacterium]